MPAASSASVDVAPIDSSRNPADSVPRGIAPQATPRAAVAARLPASVGPQVAIANIARGNRSARSGGNVARSTDAMPGSLHPRLVNG